MKVCGKINQSSKQILAHPKFWLKKFVSLGMSKKNKTDWTKAIQSVKNSMMKKQIILYLKWRLQKKKNIDLPCYTSNTVQDSFKKQIRRAARKGHTKIVKILASLTDNPNAPDKYGWTPIYCAAGRGHTEIVKILAPLTDNPNTKDNYGKTPVAVAKTKEIKEILKSFKTSRKRKAKPSGNPSKKQAGDF